ncbi:MAG TPA: helix-hairpin-helix domain-containing protein [Dehalococcoidia bacterium]|nr:helix-hairpin-helix domain-containing protein [Dehalococcoidia bacterium]
MSRANRFYLSIIVLLLIAAIAGGVTLVVQHSRNQPVAINLSQTKLPEQSGTLYIGGAVANPGIYTWQEGDTIKALLMDTGVEADANLSRIEIYIPREGEEQLPQKIDINRAESWLLDALPGIGEVIAQRIVDYRSENGLFQRIEDLLNVKGISQGTFDKIKDYITVSD